MTSAESASTSDHVDVLIVGAGLSGIGAAYHLQKRCPSRSYRILEARERSGGTWDLFRYPGVRSDSDMYTLGYSFKPWTQPKAIADGASILAYVRETAREHGIEPHIQFASRVIEVSWDSGRARWTVSIERGPQRAREQMSCSFLFMCSGYYRYEAGYTPAFEGVDDFKGRLIHPQHWPEDLDYRGKTVLVIGSGATAVTLVPEMARAAAHVTMLQRSPTYMVSRPSEDRIANSLRRWLPERLAYGVVRWKNVLLGMYVFNACRRRPQRAKAAIIDMMRKELPPAYDVATHFTPRYNPWEQRLCLVPDSDLFKAIREDRVSVVTDRISRFNSAGVLLESGRQLDADIIVTATGLELQFLGGAQVIVDGKTIDPASVYGYKGMMYSDVPNLASAFGYTNASWTLKADLTCEYVCRVLNHMQKSGTRQVTPRLRDPNIQPERWIDFSSGYFERALSRFPKQGSKHPWKLYQNYARDILLLRLGRLDDGTLEFKP